MEASGRGGMAPMGMVWAHASTRAARAKRWTIVMASANCLIPLVVSRHHDHSAALVPAVAVRQEVKVMSAD